MTHSEVHEEHLAMSGAIEIAVLDDDEDFLQFMDDVLGDEGGYRVRCFTSPETMYANFQDLLPAILLLDMKMGEYRGDVVLQEVQTRWPEICIIVVTGYPSLDDMRARFQQNVFDYLAKPFSIDQLRETLNKAIVTFGLGRSQQDLLRERLGPRIRMLRTEKNWSLKELAAVTGLSVSQLSSIERGAHLPSMESFLAICTAMDQKPSAVFASITF
jgi:DNA-binding NtrC family response regulator